MTDVDLLRIKSKLQHMQDQCAYSEQAALRHYEQVKWKGERHASDDKQELMSAVELHADYVRLHAQLTEILTLFEHETRPPPAPGGPAGD